MLSLADCLLASSACFPTTCLAPVFSDACFLRFAFAKVGQTLANKNQSLFLLPDKQGRCPYSALKQLQKAELHPSAYHNITGVISLRGGMRQEGRGLGTTIRGMTQQLAPRWWEIQLPLDLDLHYMLIVID